MKILNQEKLYNILNFYGFLFNHLDKDDVIDTIKESTSISELEDSLLEKVNEVEFIYYSDAMEFLSLHDASLGKSLELAEELGYTIKDIDSTILATLLLQNMLREQVYNLINDLEEEEILKE